MVRRIGDAKTPASGAKSHLTERSEFCGLVTYSKTRASAHSLGVPPSRSLPLARRSLRKFSRSSSVVIHGQRQKRGWTVDDSGMHLVKTDRYGVVFLVSRCILDHGRDHVPRDRLCFGSRRMCHFPAENNLPEHDRVVVSLVMGGIDKRDGALTRQRL